MNKTKLLISAIASFVILTLVVYFFSIYNPQLAGSSSFDQNIEESVTNGVFLFDLKHYKNNITISDSESLFIEKAWVSNSWVYNNFSKKVKNISSYILNVNFANRLNNYPKSKYNNKDLIIMKYDKLEKFYDPSNGTNSVNFNIYNIEPSAKNYQ